MGKQLTGKTATLQQLISKVFSFLPKTFVLGAIHPLVQSLDKNALMHWKGQTGTTATTKAVKMNGNHKSIS